MKSFFSMIMVVLCLFGLTINNAFAQTDSTTVEKQVVVITMKNEKIFKARIADLLIVKVDEIEEKEF